MNINGIDYPDNEVVKAHRVFTKFRLSNPIIHNILIEGVKRTEHLEQENNVLKGKMKVITNIINQE